MLKLYIISVVISLLVTTINFEATKAKLKREGIEVKEIKYSLAEYIQNYIHLLIPIWNIFLAIVMQFKSEELYEKYKEKKLAELRRS